MDTSVIIAVIAAVQAIGVAVIGGMFARSSANNNAYRIKREKAEAEAAKAEAEREKRREERDVAILALEFACAEGTEVLLEAARGDKVNGNVEKALKNIEKSRGRLNHIINTEAMKRSA